MTPSSLAPADAESAIDAFIEELRPQFDEPLGTLSTNTYYKAVQLGWKGHMTGWSNRLFAARAVPAEEVQDANG